jgi:hypothetical protein
MSVTPVPPERCGHVAPMVIDRGQGGYAARCLRCGTVGPVRETSAEARRALLELAQAKIATPPRSSPYTSPLAGFGGAVGYRGYKSATTV